ncbi:MAG TPA: GGDEF domain-containing protein [Caulobacteraceae bacterium]
MSLADPQDEIERLRAEVEALRARAEAAEALAERDVLTPALNRRGFVREVNRAMAFARRHGTPATLLYLDMDGFKAINDSLGHAAGDAALVRVARLLIDEVRGGDAVGRMGGDEFAVLLLGADLEQGRAKAAALEAALAGAPFEFEGKAARLGASFGVRALPEALDAEGWLAEADAAMWLRKNGR